MQCGAVRSSAEQCGSVRCGAEQCDNGCVGALRCGAIMGGLVRCGTVRFKGSDLALLPSLMYGGRQYHHCPLRVLGCVEGRVFSHSQKPYPPKTPGAC